MFSIRSLPIVPLKLLSQARKLSNKSAFISKPHRAIYARTYPTVLVQPDGSSFTIRYHEPRRIITLPLDLTTLTEEQQKARLEKRKPKTKVVIEEDIQDNFSAHNKKYIRFIKKK